MTNYISAGLVVLYLSITTICTLTLLKIAGLHLSDTMFIVSGISWILFCFSAAWWMPSLFLFLKHPVRQPMQSEAAKLNTAWKIIGTQLTKEQQREIKLRVLESREWNAFATGTKTIVVSKAMIADLTEPELCGVLAHELGHLLSYDTIIASAYSMAGVLPRTIKTTYRYIANGLYTGVKIGCLFSGLLGALVVLLIFYILHILQTAAMLTIITGVFIILDLVFRFLDLLLSRLAEYRQDAFAAYLGFGKELKDVLEKLSQEQEQQVNSYYIIFHSAHPVIYNRIRRLEIPDTLASPPPIAHTDTSPPAST